MPKRRSRFIAAILSLFLYGVIRLLVPGIIDAAPYMERFVWQFDLLLLTAGVLSVIGAVGNAAVSRLTLFLRILVMFLVCYGIPSSPLVPVLFVLASAQETGFRQGPGWGGIIIAATIFVVLATMVPPRTAFFVPVPGLERRELLVFIALVLPAIILAQVLRWASFREERWRETVDRLDVAVSRLAEANLGYQGYAQEVRGASIAGERRRISREIHDTVGYSLTNIRVMLEAAKLRMGEDPAGTSDLLEQSMEEAGLCLEQTRQAMRQLRGREVLVVTGLAAIQRLVRAFSEVTGIRVEAEYGNVVPEWPIPVEKAAYRLVQEGMTNAFRHGMATEIMIYLWQDDETLRLIVRDNGSGSGEIKEGLGITGMRERVEALGGTVEVGPRPDGFEVRARLPLSGENGHHADQNSAG